MSEISLTELRAEFARLAAALDRHPRAGERAALKADIVALFKQTEATAAELNAFKESIRALVDRFKALPAEPEPQSVRHDHIGASTSIERGWSELAAGNWSAAENFFREAMSRDATSAAAQALLGWALLQQGRNDEALQLCLRVLVREPEHGLARVAVGAVCLRKGILGEAIEHLSRVASHSSDARAALYANYWLGVAYIERDMPGDATEFLRRAVMQGPNLAEGWAELGRALWAQNRHADARTAWATGAAVRHSPFASRCAEMLDAVATGGAPTRPLSA